MHYCGGFSLMEVMVSLLLLSLGLLGLDAMELYANKEIQAIYYFNQAVNQLNNLTERLNQSSVQVDQQVEDWNAENKAVLPHGQGEISGEFPIFTATIYWGNAQKNCVYHHLGVSGCLQKIIYLG